MAVLPADGPVVLVSGLPEGFDWRQRTAPVESIIVELRDELVMAGWFDAEVRLLMPVDDDEFPEPDKTAVHEPARIVVEPGARAVVGSWQVRGSRAVPGERLVRSLPVDVPFTSRVIGYGADRLLMIYEQEGFPFAKVVSRSVEPIGDGEYAVTLGVEEGRAVQVEFLSFEGAELVSARVLSRFALFAPEAWHPQRIDYWQRNIDASALVEVESRELARSADAHGVLFRVRPRRANRISGAVGYDPVEGELAGYARLVLRNIANTGRSLRAGWEGLPGRLRYELSYTEPWLFGSDFSLTIGIRHQSFDTVAGRTEFETEAVVPIAPDARLSFGTGYEMLTGVLPPLETRVLSGMSGISYDRRRPYHDPEAGLLLELRTWAGTRRERIRPSVEAVAEPGTESSRFIGRVEADTEFIGPGFGRFLVANRAYGRFIETPAVLSELELYHLGGAATVRGYREEEFLSRRAGWSNSEFSYRVGPGTSAYLFLDMGAVWPKAEGYETGRSGQVFVPTGTRDLTGRRFLLGYGPGSRVRTRVGVFEAAYGLSPAVGPLSGKLHFRYEGDF